jgi:peptidoglycan/xylan/chitin deacetylase (PgdA/CDA1 family)
MVGSYWGIGAVATQRGRRLASPFVVSSVATQRPAVALTFDDGPDARHTRGVVDALGASRATFFVLGNRTRQWPSIVRETAEAGHEIASHGYDHTHLWKLSPSQTMQDLRDGRQAIIDATGRPPAAYRPPHGLFNLSAWIGAEKLGMRRTLWSASARDWADDASPESITARALAGARAGAVILMHDGGGSSDRAEKTVQAVPAILAGLRQLGLEAVTLTELLANRLEPTR